jgi:hypothetical protein
MIEFLVGVNHAGLMSCREAPYIGHEAGGAASGQPEFSHREFS